MELMGKAAACGILVVLAAAFLKSRNRELALILSLCSCAILLFLTLGQAVGLLDELRDFETITGMEDRILPPLLQVCGITVLTQFSCAFCREAGEQALAKVLELCGNTASLISVLPLLKQIFALLKRFLGE